MEKVVFLDRDGVINKYPGHFQYVTSWDEFSFLPNVKAALRRLHKEGYKIFVVSNQAGVSKGVYSQKSLDTITENMLEELNKEGAALDGVYYCTHRPEDNCPCRKPKTGLIERAFSQLQSETKDRGRGLAYFVGDSILDMQTGKAAGLKTILVFSGRETPENKDSWSIIPDFTARDLSEAVDIILRRP